MDFRRLKWAKFILLGDVRLSQEPPESASFVIHRPENDKSEAQVRVFNDMYVTAMLQMLRDHHVRQLYATRGLAVLTETAVLQQDICLELTYRT